MLTITHHALLDDPTFNDAQNHTSLGHLRGDANEAADAVSRAKWKVFSALCRRLRIQPHQLAVPEECHSILLKVLNAAIQRGVRVRPNPYVASEQQVPDGYQQHLPTSDASARLRQRDEHQQPRLDSRLTKELEAEQLRGKKNRSNDMGDGPGAYAAAKQMAERDRQRRRSNRLRPLATGSRDTPHRSRLRVRWWYRRQK